MPILEFAGFFLFILVLGYLVPAGQFYFLYHVRHSKANEAHRIQHREIQPGQIRREIKLSLSTIFIFSVMSTGLFELYKAGHTSIYLHLRDYPPGYGVLSFFLALFIHDTYFYWTHRVMHWPRFFKYVHLGHHRSVTPTPWALFAFQPLEAIIQFCGIILIVVFLPLHPLVLLGFLWYDTLINTAGHTGYEMMPPAMTRVWPFKYFNTVTHHDNHHTNTRANFGAFFNLWDRWMGTFEDASAHSEQPAPSHALHSDDRRLTA